MNQVNDPLTAWVLEDPSTRAPLALGVLGALLVLPLAIFAVYMLRLGTSAVTMREFPPRGYRLLRSVTPITGDMAVRQGRLIRIMAMLLLAGAIAIAIFMWRFGVLLGRSH
ncbi:MAG TPA: hypothetical protein VFV51_19130 [Vicinamibacterales bacterium]|nr:hypothetical protein [Vicinamibacterales bacterium]